MVATISSELWMINLIMEERIGFRIPRGADNKLISLAGMVVLIRTVGRSLDLNSDSTILEN